jgi:hypothetical protein
VYEAYLFCFLFDVRLSFHLLSSDPRVWISETIASRSWGIPRPISAGLLYPASYYVAWGIDAYSKAIKVNAAPRGISLLFLVTFSRVSQQCNLVHLKVIVFHAVWMNCYEIWYLIVYLQLLMLRTNIFFCKCFDWNYRTHGLSHEPQNKFDEIFEAEVVASFNATLDVHDVIF